MTLPPAGAPSAARARSRRTRRGPTGSPRRCGPPRRRPAPATVPRPGLEARLGLGVVRVRRLDRTREADQRGLRDLHRDVRLLNGGGLLLRQHRDVGARHARRARRPHRAGRRRPGRRTASAGRADVPVRDRRQRAVVGRRRCRCRRRGARAPRQRRRQREVWAELRGDGRVSASSPVTAGARLRSTGSRSTACWRPASSGGSGRSGERLPGRVQHRVLDARRRRQRRTARTPSPPRARIRSTSNRVRSASARVSSMGACRPVFTSPPPCRGGHGRVERVLGRHEHRARALHAEVGLLDDQVDAQALRVGTMFLCLVRRRRPPPPGRRCARSRRPPGRHRWRPAWTSTGETSRCCSTCVPPIRGRSTSGAPRYEAVLLLVVPSNACAVAPNAGSHCARGTRVSAAAAATRARALCSDG